ncbi:MAG: hypothetical protein E6Z84_14880 [Clostridium sp.]|uniref:hypothetical protein n=1 Tax=Clostridium sp. TaxID=1506 RepID=UPI00290E409F|nr:hypothetical protein [Clostridium sp.]MDU5742035.1 hypothetical protein [Clostridium sp.]MDU5786438.1 hypothetical protein [Clostridium sp.]
MAKNTVNKGINAKRIQQIEIYDYSIGNLFNINFRQQLVLNPIGLQLNLTKLKELREELQGFDIDIKEIDCNRVFGGNTELTETEVFIRSINSYLNYRSDYNKILQTKELDRDFPREEREKLADDLEEEIKKEYRKIATVGKINKILRHASEEKVKELGVQLRDILSTLEVATEEHINNMLYLIATSKIAEIKSRVEEKIIYLEDVMEDIA